MEQPIACLKTPMKLQENEKQLCFQISTNQLTTGSKKYLYRLGNPVSEPLNFVMK